MRNDYSIPADTTERRLLVLGCLLFVSGSVIFYMFPPYLIQMGGRLALDLEQLGSLAAVESLGIAVTSLTGPLWMSRFDHARCALFGIVVCVAGNITTAYAPGFHSMLLSRFVLSLFGEGVLVTLSYTVLGSLRSVDRGFAIALTAAVSCGAAVIAAASSLESHIPSFGTLVPLIAAPLMVLPFLSWFSSMPRPAHVNTPVAEPSLVDRRMLFALLAQAVWFGAPGAFWTFAEQVAVDKGIAASSAELALSIGEMTSLIGSLLAAGFGDRWGRLCQIVVATLGMVAAAELYVFGTTPIELALVLSLFYVCWNYGTVYQMSFVSSLDTSGRFAVMMPAAQVFGLSIGPLVAGRWMERSGDSAVVLATALFAALGTAAYLLPAYLMRRTQRAGAGAFSEP